MEYFKTTFICQCGVEGDASELVPDPNGNAYLNYGNSCPKCLTQRVSLVAKPNEQIEMDIRTSKIDDIFGIKGDEDFIIFRVLKSDVSNYLDFKRDFTKITYDYQILEEDKYFEIVIPSKIKGKIGKIKELKKKWKKFLSD